MLVSCSHASNPLLLTHLFCSSFLLPLLQVGHLAQIGSLFPVEKFLTPEFVEIGTRAAAAELISTGTTFACDMYFHTEVIGETLAKTGLRAELCGPITDGLTPNFKPGSGDALKHMRNLIKQGSSRPDRISYGIGAHSVYVCSEETLRKASEVSKETNCKLSIHTSETRKEVRPWRAGACPGCPSRSRMKR